MAAEEYLGGTTKVTKAQYKERKKYIDYINSSEINFLDTLHRKRLYGLLGRDYDVTVPVPNTKIFGDYSPAISGLNFVVDIFNEFRNYYTGLITTTDIAAPSLISSLKPTKSFVNFHESYKNYIASTGVILSRELINDGHTERLEFYNFIRIVENKLLQPEYMKYVVSKSGYALSPESDIHLTGLYIDLGKNYPPNLDALKVELVSDPEFFCYANYAQNFGFQIDFNCPWRLILNIESPYVQENILNGRPTENFYDFYADVFQMRTSGDDFWVTKTFFELLYVQHCQDVGLESIPANYSTMQLEDWLVVYLKSRFRELGLLNPKMQNSELFESTAAKMLDIYKIFGIRSNYGAIAFVNKYCSDTLRIITEGR